MANRNYASGGKIYSMHTMPVMIDCNFVVTPTNASGITALKGPTVAQVYMNTSATPAAGNPNPAAGIIVVKLQDNYNFLYNVDADFNGGTTTASTSTVANVINVISTLGTATTAQWVAKGLPVGVTPALGVPFIASSSGVIGGSAQTILATAAGAGIDHIETVGNPNLSIAPTGAFIASSLSGQGSIFYLRCYKNTVLTAPTTGALIRLRFYLSNSSVTVQGE